jgi:segregation and condensation protein A
LTKACTIKIQNFEGPLDLLFHLIEKNQFNIYDIPINDITDQYMEYLFVAQKLDLEIASEFLVMAATLLHIKSRLLLPEKKEKREEEPDPREELVIRLMEYKKYKEFSAVLKEREKQWATVYYKLPEVMEFHREEEPLELSVEELKRVYFDLLKKNMKKASPDAPKMEEIVRQEKVSLKGTMREVVRALLNRTFFRFTELFSIKKRSKAEVVSGFLAILELSKLDRVRLEQEKQLSEILVYRNSTEIKVWEED